MIFFISTHRFQKQKLTWRDFVFYAQTNCIWICRLTLIPFQFVYVSMVLLMLGFIKKSQHFLQAKDFKHIVITHGTDTLIETAKYLGSRSTAEGDGNTSFLLFFVVFFGGGGVEFGMLDSVCFSLSWRNLMVLGSFCWLLPTKIHAQQVWWKCAKHEKLTEVIQYGSSNLGESCFYIQDLCVYIVSSL